MMGKARKMFAILLAAALLLPGTGALAAEPVTVTGKSMMHFVVDGVEYAPPEDAVGGFFYDGGKYTYVPLRFVAYILKKDVSWDNESKQVSIFDPQSEEDLARIEAYLEERKVADSAIEPAGPAKADVLPIRVVPEVSYVFNGQPAKPGEETPGLMIDGSLYVPMRFITENLGYKLNWDSTTFTISADIADVDRIVRHYRELAETMKGDVMEEALGILQEMGISNPVDVFLGRIGEEQMAGLLEIAAAFLPEVEERLDGLIGAMRAELEAIGQPTLLADQLYKELDHLLDQARKFLAADETGS